MRYLIIFIFLLSNVYCSGQEHEEIYTIKTKDKQLVYGKIQKITSDSIIINSELLGVLRFSRDEVTSFIKGKSLYSFANDSEPYFVHTGIPNGKGNHFYRNYALFGQHFSFGLNDHFDLTTGFELISPIANGELLFPIMHLGAKYSGALNEKLHVGISSKLYFNGQGGIIFINVPITIGGTRTNVTISPSYSLTLDGYSDSYFTPFFNINLALSKKFRLVVDGVITSDLTLGTALMEIKSKKNRIISLGFIFSNEFSLIPNIALTLPIGKGPKK